MTLFKIPTVMTADELVDVAFRRAAKAVKPKMAKSKLSTDRAMAIAKLQTVQDVLGTKLKNYIESFPSIDRLHPFYYQLIDVMVGCDRVKKNLGAMDWARRKIVGVCSSNISKIKKLNEPADIHASRNAAYGRVSSVLNQVNDELVFINTVRETLNKLPEIDVELPTVVIAGFPNVGKSMLVKLLSSARPEVAAYPFTTKHVLVGHFEHRYKKYQVIDTPGLLDSDPATKKSIERQAVLALEHLADLIVYILDPSEYCGYPFELQLSLLDRLRAVFPKTSMLVVENKCDLKRTDSLNLKISAETLEGIDELRRRILDELAKQQDNKPSEGLGVELRGKGSG